MGEIALRQAILHALIAAGLVEAALRTWGIRRAQARLRFWLVALAFPFLVLPLFLLAVPFRATDRFAAGWALFSGDRWNDVRLAGVGIDTIAFAGLALAGTLLFLRDGVPFLVIAIRERGETSMARAAPGTLLATVGDLARQTGCRAPAVALLPAEGPVLFVRGLLDHTLVLSDGVLARLSHDQLRAAVAHELAHVRFRDPLAGWLLMGARLIMFWNPAVQLVARAVVQELEHRADSTAAELTSAGAVAGALAALSDRPALERGTCDRRFRPSGRGKAASLESLSERLHHAHIAGRAERVLTPLADPPFARTRLALLGVTLAALLFFVV